MPTKMNAARRALATSHLAALFLTAVAAVSPGSAQKPPPLDEASRSAPNSQQGQRQPQPGTSRGATLQAPSPPPAAPRTTASAPAAPPASLPSLPEPAILGIRLGMTADEARAKLAEAAKDVAVFEVWADKADGTGRYLRGLGFKREYTAVDGYEAAQAALLQIRPRQRTFIREQASVVFGEFDTRVMEVMRSESFPEDARPSVQKVSEAVEAAYGGKLVREVTWNSTRFAFRHMRDAQGVPTQDRQCLGTLEGSGVGGFAVGGLVTFGQHSPRCGRLLVVYAGLDRDEAIATSLSQHMADSQAVLKDRADQRQAAQAVAERRRQEELGRASQQAAPRL